MRFYEDDVWESLINNKNRALNRGFGFFIKEGVSDELRQKLRNIQDEELERGDPYWILDFLAEDFELDPDCIEYRGLCYYRKYKPKPQNGTKENE